MKVLFVCTGNTCRSPMAKVLYNLITETSDAESRGLYVNFPSEASFNAQKAVKAYGADLENHISRQITMDDAQKSDIIITMTKAHKEALIGVGVENKVVTLHEFAHEDGDVSDPFGGSEEIYKKTCEEIYRLIKKGVDNLDLAKTGDAEEITKLEKDIFPDAWSENAILREIENKRIIVIKEKQKIIGYCIFMLGGDQGEILRIAVKEDAREKGVGKKLLEKAFKKMKDEGITEVFLEVRSRNSAAISLYEKMGFEKIDVRKKYYGDDDALIFKKAELER